MRSSSAQTEEEEEDGEVSEENHREVQEEGHGAVWGGKTDGKQVT